MIPRCLALVIVLATPGCGLFRADAIGERENALAAAGFTVRPIANTAQAVMIARVASDRISQRVEGANVSYIFPDPVKCHCVYFGGQAAYGRYQQIAIRRNIPRDQVEVAQLNSGADWDWGPWGGYGLDFY